MTLRCEFQKEGHLLTPFTAGRLKDTEETKRKRKACCQSPSLFTEIGNKI